MNPLARIRSFLRRFTSPPESPTSEEPEPNTSLPEGYRESLHSIGAFDSPATFDHSEYCIHCDLCGETYPDYWSWFNAGRDEHGFTAIDEARKHTTIVVPEGFEESDNPDFDYNEGSEGLHSVPYDTPEDGVPSPAERFKEASDER